MVEYDNILLGGISFWDFCVSGICLNDSTKAPYSTNGFSTRFHQGSIFHQHVFTQIPPSRYIPPTCFHPDSTKAVHSTNLFSPRFHQRGRFHQLFSQSSTSFLCFIFRGLVNFDKGDRQPGGNNCFLIGLLVPTGQSPFVRNRVLHGL